MAWDFCDSFIEYTTNGPEVQYYWDVASSVAGTGTSTGRFANSGRSVYSAAGAPVFIKTSAVNDGVHHVVISYSQSVAPVGGGTNIGPYWELVDGSTVQCTIAYRNDGSWLLLAGGHTSTTVLAGPWTGAVTAANFWYGFEFEVVIHPTAGSFAIRKNGNTVNDFAATGLNTRASVNSYANKLQFGISGAGYSYLSDFWWRSSASAVAWLGDIRTYIRPPSGNASVQWTPSPALLNQNTATANGTSTFAANTVFGCVFTANVTGLVNTMSFNFNAAITGHVKMALYDNSGPSSYAGNLIAQSSELTNPPAGVVVFTMPTPPTLTKGTNYYAVVWSDTAIVGFGTSAYTNFSPVTTYGANFPAVFPTPVNNFVNGSGSQAAYIQPPNWSCVSEYPSDLGNTYVQDANVNDTDLYTVAAISQTPASILGVFTRAYMTKSDAGPRTAQVLLKSGGAVVGGNTLTLDNAFWKFSWRLDLNDPNTGAAWTAVAVNSANVGVKVVS